ncbi:MAG: S9 family peptidase [Maricaulaceae bacterium]|nr:S9 family peptidase [Maricaulaceae bacterium]
MNKTLWTAAASAAALALAACGEQTPYAPPADDGAAMDAAPAAERRIVEIDPDNDPRVWLEEVEGEEALNWARAENQRAYERLQGDARYEEFFGQALEIYQSQDRIPFGSVRGDYVYNFWQDAQNTHGLWRRATLESYLSNDIEWETILDLDALAAEEGMNWVWRGASCAPLPSTRCILTLSNGGLDAAHRREFDIEERAFVEGGFVIPETKGGTSWADEDTLMIATALDPETTTDSGYPFAVQRWARGTPLSEAAEAIRGERANVGVWTARLEGTDGEAHVLAVQRVTFFEGINWVLPEEGEPVALPLPLRHSLDGLYRGQLVFRINQDWSPEGDTATYPQGSVLSFDLNEFLDTGELPRVHIVFAPGARQSVRSVGVSASAVLMAIDENVTGGAFAFDFNGDGWTMSEIATPDNLAISMFGASPEHNVAFLSVQGFLTPSSMYVIDAAARSARLAKSSPAWFDAEGLIVEQHEVRSPDGTYIPYFLVRREDIELNGDTPVFLHAYGGFQITSSPGYSGVRGRLWLERGGAFALANIRGGGEFGPAWHQAGLKTERQRIYDDMIAVAEDLIRRGVTRPDRLGVNGGSNGGLLTGVMYTQRPDLWGAVVSAVPLLDMLRYHRLLAGASWMGEYGDPDDPVEGAFLRSISPYHNVDANADYPEIYIYTSTKDDRVHPGHARKMAHLLSELGHPYLYYENIEGGHSAAANLEELARRDAMLYVFMSQRLMDRPAAGEADGAEE